MVEKMVMIKYLDFKFNLSLCTSNLYVDLDKLVKIDIMWNSKKQIEICHDEKVYGTIWTNYIIDGKNIENG